MARWSWWVLSAVVFSSCPTVKPPCETVQCGAAEACNATTGRCEALPACTPDGACAQGSCVGEVCSSCAANIVCTAGFTGCDPSSGNCAQCRSNADCAAPTPVCRGAFGCVECAADSDCPAATPLCTSDHRCGVCKADGDCATGQRCHGGLCLDDCGPNGECPTSRPECTPYGCAECYSRRDCPRGEACYKGDCRPAPPGEICETALPLTLSGGSVIAQGTFISYVSESFGGSSDPDDLYFKVEVTEESALNLDLAANGSLLIEPSAELYPDCVGPGVVSGPTWRDVFVVPGTYFIRLTSGAVGYNFTLHLWTTPASRPAGANCLKPIVLPLDAQGRATVTGDTRGLPAAGTGACDRGVGRLVYEVQVPTLSTVTARVTPLEATFSPDLSLKRECLVGRPDRCTGAPVGQPRTADLDFVEPGPFTVQVGDLDGTAGSFTLDVAVAPMATNVSCDTAAPLVFDGGVATAQGLQHAEFGPCTCFQLNCGNGRQVWRLSTAGLGTRSLQLRVTPESGPAPGLSLITACDLQSPDTATVACDGRSMTGPRSLDVPALPEGDYFVEIGEASSPFRLEATLGSAFPPPSNDDCAAPTVLDVSAAPVSVSGDTRGAMTNKALSCLAGIDPQQGRDVVYQLQSSGRGRATLTLTPGAGTFDPVMEVLDTCTSQSGGACSNDGGVGGVETVSVDLSGTPRFLWVKGAAGTSGTFQLAASFTPAPANDTCAGATTLTLPQTVTGTTVGSFNDFTSCDVSTTGPDLFYKFTYTGSNNGTVNVTLTPTGFDARLFVLTTSCAATTCTRFVNAAGSGQPETLSLSVSRNVTYYLGVEGDVGGAFTLSVQ